LIIKHYQNDIYRFCFYRVKSKMDAEDLAQDIFIKAFKRIDSLKEPEKFKAWLYRIALNRIKDFYRSRKSFRFSDFILSGFNRSGESNNKTWEPEPFEKETISGRIEKKEFWEHVSGFTSLLSKMEKDVFLFRFFDGMTLKETAEIMKKSESTVKTHLYRATAKFQKNKSLRDCLKEYDDEK